ncbi:hypothetical protein AVEN_137631-1 [Araneus ventricosus]|uniref:Uncharacterized protein n=1 Tax=Araneus ventricosus TaxID=182803 RepID=A0A4Y2CPH3_ARAVE|nr:hypothetical protein AVEN_137631-1 [Araneus ventricosus]
MTDRVSLPPSTKTKPESANSRASSRRPCNGPVARRLGRIKENYRRPEELFKWFQCIPRIEMSRDQLSKYPNLIVAVSSGSGRENVARGGTREYLILILWLPIIAETLKFGFHVER